MYIDGESEGSKVFAQFMLIAWQIARTDKNLSVFISAAVLIGK